MFCRCICLSEHLTVQVDWEIILPSIYRQNKKKRGSLKYPHVSQTWPLATVSHHDLNHEP